MKEQRRRRLALLLLAAAAAGFLGYCLGYAYGSRGQTDFSISAERTVSQAELSLGGDTSSSGGISSAAGEETNERVDLNHADAETLQQLPGIGPKRAEAIIEYREQYGIFVTTDEVMNVPGIGPELYEQIKDRVMVDYK